jgi:serine protease
LFGIVWVVKMNNKKILVMLILSSLIMGTVPVSAVTPQDDSLIKVYENNIISTSSNVEYVPGEIIVKFKPGVKGSEIANINSKHKTKVISTSQHGDFKLLKIAKGKSVPEMVEIYNRNPNVEHAEPNMIAYAHYAPNDPFYSYQWHFNQINMESAWDSSTGSGVIVAVLDTGVAQDLEDSPAYFVAGYDFINNDDDADDDNGHGSHVAGTIAQNTGNGIGVAGVAYSASIMPVKVLDSGGSGSYFNVSDGIVWAAINGADVISMSLGGPCDFSSMLLEDALSFAYNEKGVVIVASSGNSGKEKYSCPAAYDDYVIAVGATRFDEAVPRYSSYYSYTGHPTIKQYVDVTAPGGDTRVDQNSDGYGDGVLQQTLGGYYFYQGTSMAAPHVSGVAALVIANGNADANGDGTTSPDEVRNVLESSAKDKDVPGWDPKYGYGIVDANAALLWTTDATPVNNSPVATEDDYSVEEDTVINVEEALGVLSNDLDDENDPLTAVLATGVSNGGLTLNSDGSFRYEPNDDFTGYDSFTYKANDGFSDSNIVTVDITVNPVNDIPVAYDQSVTTQEGTAVDIVLNGNDVEGDALEYIIITYPTFGTLSGNAQNLIYTPEASFTGEDSFTFKVNDTKADSNPATVSITVTDVMPTIYMHVESIEMSLNKWGVFTRASALITVVNSDDVRVEGANVIGEWSEATTNVDSGLTDTNGQVLLYSNILKKAPSDTSFTFTVSDVTHSEYSYNAAANFETSNSIP